jgi:2-succinyl-6-hydroxy-2,4-cyclohexadiene-1-carboxylate synthase
MSAPAKPRENFRIGPQHVEVWGDGRLPYLLLVHGIASSRAQWRPNLQALAGVATPVVVELLGHGRSDAPDDPALYAVGAYFERFEQLRRHLGAETWAVCGQSFGAGLTLGYALAHPERCRAQIFTNSASALGAIRPAPTSSEAMERVTAIEARGRAALETLPFFPKRNGRLAPDLEAELMADAAKVSAAGMARTMTFTVPGLSVVDRLEAITTPTLLVNGRREKAFQDRRDEAARRIPGLQVIDLDGGHPVNVDCAEGFNGAVFDFLSVPGGRKWSK